MIFQFLKPASLELGERLSIARSTLRIRVEALDVHWDMTKSLDDAEAVASARTAIKDALARLTETAAKAFYDVIVLDEIVFCLAKGLAELGDICNLIETKAPNVELVLTGRGACDELLRKADLGTEMTDIKHPFDSAGQTRRGIDF